MSWPSNAFSFVGSSLSSVSPWPNCPSSPRPHEQTTFPPIKRVKMNEVNKASYGHGYEENEKEELKYEPQKWAFIYEELLTTYKKTKNPIPIYWMIQMQIS